MRLPSGHVPDWQAHEEIVAAVYSLMGYTVVPNISVDGKQTDMICEKSVPGAGTLRIYVECKYSQMGKQDSVSNKEVDEFIAAYLSRREANRFSHGVMVANSSYTAHARAAAAKHPTVSLKTLDDLYEDVLALRSYLQIAIDSYENEGSFQTYIPLRGRKINSSGENLGAPKSLSRQVTMWLEDIDSPQMAILGDFGSGNVNYHHL